ncbi:MAG: hypothetical protein B7X11_04115, partial [Acidobacteria bacterium 37-65-4]
FDPLSTLSIRPLNLSVEVLLLVLVESLLVAGIGGALGLLLAKLFSLQGDPTRGLLPMSSCSVRETWTMHRWATPMKPPHR